MHLTADWDDLEAALAVGLPAAEVSPLGPPVHTADRLDLDIRAVTGERGRFTATRLDPPSADADPVSMRLTCRIGPLGDPQRERRLLRAVADRLTQLKGVDWAPLDD